MPVFVAHAIVSCVLAAVFLAVLRLFPDQVGGYVLFGLAVFVIVHSIWEAFAITFGRRRKRR